MERSKSADATIYLASIWFIISACFASAGLVIASRRFRAWLTSRKRGE